MIRRFKRWTMKVARKLHKLDKHTHGAVSTFIAAVVLAFLLVSVFITNEVSQKKVQYVSQAQVISPDEAACNTSCTGQTINGSKMGGGSCLGYCLGSGSEINNPQFPSCRPPSGAGTSQCCCWPLATPVCTINMATPPHNTGQTYPISAGNQSYTGGNITYTWTVVNATNGTPFGTLSSTTTQSINWTAPATTANGTLGTVKLVINDTVMGTSCTQQQAVQLPADTCNADCVVGGYTQGSCQQNVTVLGGGLCSTGGTTINGNGGCGTQTCCCVSTGATATPTPTVTVTCTESDGGLNYNQQGSMYYCNSVGSCQTTTDLCFSSTILNENYCDAAKNGVLQQYTCPNGCANGACITTTAPTATPTPDAANCSIFCNANPVGSSGYCSTTATTCPNGGTRNSAFASCNASSACCCTTGAVPPTATPTSIACQTNPTCPAGSTCQAGVCISGPPPTATATTAPPTATPAACTGAASNTCAYGYVCITATPQNLCVTGTPTPTFTVAPTQPATPTCFNPKPPLWSPGVVRNNDQLTIGWDTQAAGLSSKVEVCYNGGGTCQIVFEGTGPAVNSLQKTVPVIAGKDIIVQITTTDLRCGTISDLISRPLAAGTSTALNTPVATIAYANGTSAWIIAGAAFIVILLITVAIVAM